MSSFLCTILTIPLNSKTAVTYLVVLSTMPSTPFLILCCVSRSCRRGRVTSSAKEAASTLWYSQGQEHRSYYHCVEMVSH